VIDPAPQEVQEATFDWVLKVPAAQAEQDVAPVEFPVLVMDPAEHELQLDTFDSTL
jgi:hypothetical protein